MTCQYSYLPFVLLLFSFHFAGAQNEIPNFYTLKDHIEVNNSASSTAKSLHEEDLEEHFERWQYFVKPRMKPDGSLYAADALWNTFSHQQKITPTRDIGWHPVGPFDTPKNGGGVGRVNVIRFVKQKPEIIYIGTACGGVWKSTNNGINWFPLTDSLPSLSISDIAINPTNPNEIYIATGDPFGTELWTGQHFDFWGGTYSAGIFKSTNAGQTWQSCGLTYTQTQSEIIQRLLINPQNPNILLAATRKGVFRSENKGDDWLKVSENHYFDMEWDVRFPNKVFAISAEHLAISKDYGQTWQVQTTAVPHEGRLSLANSLSQPNYLYVLDGQGNLYLTKDSSFKFQLTARPPINTFLYFSSVLEVSPNNGNHVIVGGVEIAQSFDAGQTWKVITSSQAYKAPNYVHADQHGFAFQPNTQHFFAVNDGGVFVTTDVGQTWKSKNKGLQISQMYRISNHETEQQTIYAGLQDNGILKFDNAEWSEVLSFTDGMECLMKPENPNEVFVNGQYGRLFYSDDAGNTFKEQINDPKGGWVAPMLLHPRKTDELYDVSENQMFMSDDNGEEWTDKSEVFDISELIHIEISPSHPNIFYALSYEKLLKSTDKGQSWQDITRNLPVTQAALTSVAISDYNPQKIWVTFSGFEENSKVFASQDGGLSWKNISYQLPNIPVNCIKYQPQSQDVLYIGTDIGVYYKIGTEKNWAAYNHNLPNTIINDIALNTSLRVMRVATFGRGLWEASFPQNAVLNKDISLLSSYIEEEISLCNKTITPEIHLRNNGLDTIYQAIITQKLDHQILHLDTLNLAFPPNTTQLITLPTFVADTGMHKFTVYLSDAAANPDENHGNDTLDLFFNVQPYQIADTFQQDFELAIPNDWQLSQPDAIKKGKAGAFEASESSLLLEFYPQSQFQTLTFELPSMNFTQLQVPLYLHFDWAHVKRYETDFKDVMQIEVSVDCGNSWQTLYENTSILPTLNTNFQYFLPNKNDWQSENISLENYLNTENIKVRFVFQGENTNNYWLDNIGLIHKIQYPAQELKLYPTYIEGNITLEILGEFDNSPRLIIYDLVGKKVDELQINMQQQRKKVIDLPNLSSQNYVFQVITKNNNKTWKVFSK